MNYRPDIDGLRALAVLAVVFYHAGLGFPGGYIGVDVFFVISGFLITGILLRSFEEGTFSYRDFWMRRVYRLVPALFVVTVVTLAIGSVVLLPRDLMDLGGAAIAQPLLMSNVYFWRVVKNGYFGDPPEIRPLLHTWSLGVEEQFYVLFPLLLAAVWKLTRSRKALGLTLLLATLTSFSLCTLLTPVKGIAAFFNLPTRAWELGLGGLLHYLPASHNLTRRSREVLTGVGLTIILAGCWMLSHTTPFPGWRALIPCVGAMALLYGNSRPTATGWLLSRPLPVSIGKQSYSLYLWHWPVLAFGLYLGFISDSWSRWLAVALSFVLGFVSWRWVESTWRTGANLPRHKSIPGFVVLYGIYLLPCLMFGVTVIGAKGFPQFWPLDIPVPTNEQDRKYIYEATAAPVPVEPKFLGDFEQRQVSFLLWGDSHAMAAAAAFDVLGKKYHLKGIQLTASSTAPVASITDDRRWATVGVGKGRPVGIRSLLLDFRPKATFLVAHWSEHSSTTLAKELSETQRLLSRNNSRGYLAGDVPEFSVLPVRRSSLASRWPALFHLPTVSSHSHRLRNQDAVQAFASGWSHNVVDFARPFLHPVPPYSLDRREFFYADYHHITDKGALMLIPILEPAFLDIANPSPHTTSSWSE